MKPLRNFFLIILFILISTGARDTFSANNYPLIIGCSSVPETSVRREIRFISKPSKLHVRCFFNVPKDDIPFDKNWESQLLALDAVIDKRDTFKINLVTITLVHNASDKTNFERLKGYMDAVAERVLFLEIPDDQIYRELDAHAEVYLKNSNNLGRADIKIDIYGIKASSCPYCK